MPCRRGTKLTNLNRVTITGADDSTSIPDLVAISAIYPFVEWGILVSKRQEGGPRFPRHDWIERFSLAAEKHKLSVSMHVCGLWVRQMFVNELDWRELSLCLGVAQRIQINTHAERHVSTTGLVESLGLASHLSPAGRRQFIFQWDGVNDHLAHAVAAYGLDVAALFDTSGGAGILPDSWPSGIQLPCGYAGGLGPDNVVRQLERIEQRCSKPFWIDMERNVRTEDDSALDLRKVREVLYACRQYMRRP